MKTECESCQFPDVECTSHQVFVPHVKERESRWYCDVCASTLVSNLVRYGHKDSPILQTIAYCTNMILAKIEERNARA